MDWSKLSTLLTKHNPLFSIISKYTGAGLTGAEYEQNQFNAEQAEINRIFNSNEAALQRNWSAAEAERARDWQEEMYSKYNSLSGKIAQAEQAGVNPMLAVTGNAVSPMAAASSAPSGSAASGSAASSGGFAASAFTDLIGQMIGLKKLDAEVDVLESEAAKNRADAEGQQITNDQLRDMNAAEIMSKLSNVQLNDANIELIASKVLNTDADTEVKGAQLGQILSQIKNTDVDTDVKRQQLAVLASEVIKNNRSVDVMSAQISLMASEAGLNREKGREIAQNVRNLVQEYGHSAVMNALDEMIRSAEATDSNFRNPANYTGVSRGIRQFLNEFYGLFNVGFVSSFGTNK